MYDGSMNKICSEHGHEILVRDIVKNSFNQINIATSLNPLSSSASKPTDNDTIGSMSKDQDITEFSIRAALKKLFDYNKNMPKEIIRIVDPPCADDCLVVYSTASGIFVSFMLIVLGTPWCVEGVSPNRCI